MENELKGTYIVHRPSGQIFNNRKEAKMKLGRNNYEKARKADELVYIRKSKPNKGNWMSKTEEH